jgi:macrolide-specific efflux system membrane fusion protein
MRLTRLSMPAPGRSLAVSTALAVLIVAGGFWAYRLVVGDQTPASGASNTTPRTATVSQGDITATASASGSVESANTAAADFTTSGTVISIPVHVGDAVAKGQVLAKVDPTEAQAQLETAEANLTAAQAGLTRAKAGGDDSTITSAQTAVTNAQSTVDSAQQALDGTVLTAPMAGTVTAVNGSVGESSSASSSGFAELADLTQMQVSASFAEADATALKAGQAADVTWTALTGATATGTVATIAPTATTGNSVNSYAVTVKLTNLPTGIRIGQTVTVVVTTGSAQNVLRVPTAALKSAGGKHTVTVVDGNTEKAVIVGVGIEGGSFTEITSGLTVGQRVLLATSSGNSSTSDTNGFTGGGLGGFTGGGPGGGP